MFNAEFCFETFLVDGFRRSAIWQKNTRLQKTIGRYQQVLIHFSDSMNTIRIIFNAFFLHATHLFQPFRNVVSPLHHLTHGSSFYFWSETAGAMSIRIIVNQFLSLLNSQNFLSWWQLPLSILSHALGSRFTIHCEKSYKYFDTQVSFLPAAGGKVK